MRTAHLLNMAPAVRTELDALLAQPGAQDPARLLPEIRQELALLPKLDGLQQAGLPAADQVALLPQGLFQISVAQQGLDTLLRRVPARGVGRFVKIGAGGEKLPAFAAQWVAGLDTPGPGCTGFIGCRVCGVCSRRWYVGNVADLVPVGAAGQLAGLFAAGAGRSGWHGPAMPSKLDQLGEAGMTPARLRHFQGAVFAETRAEFIRLIERLQAVDHVPVRSYQAWLEEELSRY